MWRLLRLLGFVAVLAIAFRSRPGKRTTAEISDVEPTAEGELGRFVQVLNTANDETEADYRSALKRLQANKSPVLRDARRILEPGSQTSFALRHSTLLAVSALRDASALDLLSMVALNPQPLPPEPPDDVDRYHGGEERIRGEVLALDALDGIAALVDEGHAPAADALLKAARTGSLTLKTAAIAALAARPDQAGKLREAMDSLPADQKHIGLARYASVSDVPQVQDPTRHLAGPEQGGPAIPPLPGDKASKRRPAGARSSGAPRVSTETNHG